MQCSAKSRHEVIGSSTNEFESPPFFLGIHLNAPSKLSIIEGGPSVAIDITSTIPITCPGVTSNKPDKNCCVEIQVRHKFVDINYHFIDE